MALNIEPTIKREKKSQIIDAQKLNGKSGKLDNPTLFRLAI